MSLRNRCTWYSPRISLRPEHLGSVPTEDFPLRTEASSACLEREDHAAAASDGFCYVQIGFFMQNEFVTGRPADMSEQEAISLFSAADTEGVGSLTEDQFLEAFEVSGPPIAGSPVADAESGDDGSTISLLDVLDEMQKVIDAYRENAGEIKEVEQA